MKSFSRNIIMRSRLFTLFALLLIAGVSKFAFADRDIVYSARYYTPPGSKRTSHFHLYRINPDGTHRTQLTFGNNDDNSPQWSPDGHLILFSRINNHTEKTSVCLLDVFSGRITRLVAAPEYWSSYNWVPPGNAVVVTDETKSIVCLIDIHTHNCRRFLHISGCIFSPNGRIAYIGDNDKPALFDLSRNKVTGFPASFDAPKGEYTPSTWVDNNTIIGITSKIDDPKVHVSLISKNGNEQTNVLCRWGHSTTDPYREHFDFGGRYFMERRHASDPLVYAQDIGFSGNRPFYDYYFIDWKTGKMTDIISGQFLSWGPDNRHYCTADMRGVAPYGKIKLGHQRVVYVAGLHVHTVKSGSDSAIVEGLVCVTSADWRHVKN